MYSILSIVLIVQYKALSIHGVSILSTAMHTEFYAYLIMWEGPHLQQEMTLWVSMRPLKQTPHASEHLLDAAGRHPSDAGSKPTLSPTDKEDPPVYPFMSIYHFILIQMLDNRVQYV